MPRDARSPERSTGWDCGDWIQLRWCNPRSRSQPLAPGSDPPASVPDRQGVKENVRGRIIRVSPSQPILAIPARSIRTAGNRRSASDLENVHNELRFHIGTRLLIGAVRDNHISSLVIGRSAGLIGWRRQRAKLVQLGEAALQRRDERPCNVAMKNVLTFDAVADAATAWRY